MADFIVYLLRRYAYNQKTEGELCTPRQYLNFNRTGFSIIIVVQCHMIFKLNGIPPLPNKFYFASYEELTSSPKQDLFILICCSVNSHIF